MIGYEARSYTKLCSRNPATAAALLGVYKPIQSRVGDLPECRGAGFTDLMDHRDNIGRMSILQSLDGALPAVANLGPPSFTPRALAAARAAQLHHV